MKDYYTKKNADGTKNYYVRAGNQWVEVEKEVYLVFESDGKREMRRWEEESQFEFLSVEQIMDDYESDESVSAYVPEALQTESAETRCFECSEFSDDAEFMAWLKRRIRRMPIDRQVFIKLFFECNCSARFMAERFQLSRNRVNIFLKKVFEEIAAQYYEEGLI